MNNNLKKQFNSSVVFFELGGVKIVGNKQNGSFVGLNHEGQEYVELIFSDEMMTEEKYVQNRELDDFLTSSNYFEDVYTNNYSAAYLHLTNRCPLHCIGCYSEDESRNKQIDLTTEKIFLELDELRENGVKSLIISGGEPLLRQDIIEIVKYAKINKKFEYIAVLTSGMIFNSKIADELSKYIDDLSISIDGFSETVPTFIRDKGIYKKIIRSIEIAKAANFKSLSILPTLHKENIKYISEYANLAEAYDVKLSFSILTVPPDDILKDWIPTEKQLKLIGNNAVTIKEQVDFSKSNQKMLIEDFSIQTCDKCGIGSELISIASDGEVYPCHMCHTKELSLGNIFNEKLKDIRKKSENILSEINIEDNPTCKNCNYKYICGGGCRARAYMFHKSLNAHDPYCPMFKNFFNDFENTIKNTYSEINV